LGINYIGIGDVAISDRKDDIIKTMALGSCVGVVLYDPKLKIAAMGHIALPDSKVRSGGAVDKAGRYADTGIPLLVKAVQRKGSKGGRSLVVKIAGGAQINDPNDTFNIGKRNVLAVKKILWKCSLFLNAEDTGGTIGRTMEGGVDTGEITLSSPGRSKWKL
jgi:chemotaxis protein CheD